jgi:murein DD-endopeptidase MepM/ murein hydrolase activator NlpD
MAKSKFIYDPEKLAYIPVGTTFKEKVMKFVPYFSVGTLMGVAFYAISAVAWSTPTEKIQAQKISDMKKRQTVFVERLNEIDGVLKELEVMDDSVYRTVLGSEPLSASLRQAGTGGVDAYEEMIASNNPKDLIDAYKKLDNLVAKINVQRASYNELFKKASLNFDRIQHLPAIIPIANWDLHYIGSGFSKRFHPILQVWRMHKGIDFVASEGTKIFASADGVVSVAHFSSSFGNVVEVDHGYGIATLYAHMIKFNVKKGDKVKRGDVIGYVGDTGLSAGPHLHYEVHVHGEAVNPVNYFFNDLSAEEYKQVVAQAESIETCME